MSGGGSGSTKQTVTRTNNSPWNKNDLKFVQGEAKDLYEGGDLFQPYDQSMVVPFSSQTTDAMGQIENTANQSFAPFQSANTQAQNVLSGGGMTGGMGDALGTLQNVASGQNSIGTGGQYQGLMNDAGGPSFAQQNLSGMAAGDNLDGNPYLMESLGRGADEIQRRVNMEASAMGRGGSVAHADNLAENLGDYYSGALTQNYENARGRQMQANSMMDSQRNQGFANQLGALQGATSVEGANIANQVGAGQAAFGAGNQANAMAAQYAALAPQLYNNQYAGADRLMQVGALNEDLATRQMNDDYRQWQQGQDQDRNQVEWLNAMASGAGSLGGTSTQTSVAPATSSLSRGIGGALGGATMLGGPFGATGALIGGGLGALGGIFG